MHRMSRFASTIALVILTAFAGGCGPSREPAPAPPPVPPPAPQQESQTVTRPRPILREIQVCVVENGTIRMVTATFNPETGDTSFSGIGQVVPPPASPVANAAWFLNDEPITVEGQRFVKYGSPRVFAVGELVHVGTYAGVPLFAVPGLGSPAEALFVPLLNCVFQPYQLEAAVSAVRGG